MKYLARLTVAAFVIVAVVGVSTSRSLARPTPLACLTGTDPVVAGDAAQIAALRHTIDTILCPPAYFDGKTALRSHGAYVNCAMDAANGAIISGNLRKPCLRTIRTIYRNSTPGIKPMPPKHVCSGTCQSGSMGGNPCSFDSDCPNSTCKGGGQPCKSDLTCPAGETCVGSGRCGPSAAGTTPTVCFIDSDCKAQSQKCVYPSADCPCLHADPTKPAGLKNCNNGCAFAGDVQCCAFEFVDQAGQSGKNAACTTPPVCGNGGNPETGEVCDAGANNGGTCRGGSNAGGPCNRDGDCLSSSGPNGRCILNSCCTTNTSIDTFTGNLCGSPWCVGGTNNRQACTQDSDCPGGKCILPNPNDGGTCVGGTRDGLGCSNDLDPVKYPNEKENCPGKCQGGTSDSNPCSHDRDCPGGACNQPGKCQFHCCTNNGCQAQPPTTPCNLPPGTGADPLCNVGTCGNSGTCSNVQPLTSGTCQGGSKDGAACTQDTDCPGSGGQCVQYPCGATCNADSDCSAAPGTTCVSHVCTPSAQSCTAPLCENGACAESQPLAAGTSCAPTCAVDGDCPKGDVCVPQASGPSRCEDPQSCNTVAQCDGNKGCQQVNRPVGDPLGDSCAPTCTTNSDCTAPATCVPQASGPGRCEDLGSCNTLQCNSGQCQSLPANAGGQCPFDNTNTPCYQNTGTCQAGQCTAVPIPANPPTQCGAKCTADSDCHGPPPPAPQYKSFCVSGYCSPLSCYSPQCDGAGTCTIVGVPPVPDGTACTPGNPTTCQINGGTCRQGTCNATNLEQGALCGDGCFSNSDCTGVAPGAYCWVPPGSFFGECLNPQSCTIPLCDGGGKCTQQWQTPTLGSTNGDPCGPTCASNSDCTAPNTCNPNDFRCENLPSCHALQCSSGQCQSLPANNGGSCTLSDPCVTAAVCDSSGSCIGSGLLPDGHNCGLPDPSNCNLSPVCLSGSCTPATEACPCLKNNGLATFNSGFDVVNNDSCWSPAPCTQFVSDGSISGQMQLLAVRADNAFGCPSGSDHVDTVWAAGCVEVDGYNNFGVNVGNGSGGLATNLYAGDIPFSNGHTTPWCATTLATNSSDDTFGTCLSPTAVPDCPSCGNGQGLSSEIPGKVWLGSDIAGSEMQQCLQVLAAQAPAGSCTTTIVPECSCDGSNCPSCDDGTGILGNPRCAPIRVCGSTGCPLGPRQLKFTGTFSVCEGHQCFTGVDANKNPVGLDPNTGCQGNGDCPSGEQCTLPGFLGIPYIPAGTGVPDAYDTGFSVLKSDFVIIHGSPQAYGQNNKFGVWPGVGSSNTDPGGWSRCNPSLVACAGPYGPKCDITLSPSQQVCTCLANSPNSSGSCGVTCDACMPLGGKHPYSLIGEVNFTGESNNQNMQDRFYIGDYFGGSPPDDGKLWLRINDQHLENGSGCFSATVEVWR